MALQRNQQLSTVRRLEGSPTSGTIHKAAALLAQKQPAAVPCVLGCGYCSTLSVTVCMFTIAVFGTDNKSHLLDA